MVRSVLREGGHYIMICAERYNQKLIDGRQKAICNALGKAGLLETDQRVLFWDADKIATWVNSHPLVALWVREVAGHETTAGFRTWINESPK